MWVKNSQENRINDAVFLTEIQSYRVDRLGVVFLRAPLCPLWLRLYAR